MSAWSVPLPIKPMRKRHPRLGVMVGAMFASVFHITVAASPASAHTDLVGSDPAADSMLREAPAQVTLEFNEPMEPGLSKVALANGDRATELSVAAGSEPTTLVAELPAPPMADGTWEVTYRVTSADGHPVQGTLRFTVRQLATGTPESPASRNPESSDKAGEARGSDAFESPAPADGVASGSGEGASDAREDDGAAPWLFLAPVLGGFLLLLAALLLVIRLGRLAGGRPSDEGPARGTATASGFEGDLNRPDRP